MKNPLFFGRGLSVLNSVEISCSFCQQFLFERTFRQIAVLPFKLFSFPLCSGLIRLRPGQPLLPFALPFRGFALYC